MRRLIAWWSARLAAARWGAVVAEMGLLWWTSSLPMDGSGGGVARSLLHNSAHVIAYGGMGAMALLAVCGAGPPRPSAAVRAIAIAAAYGAIDEVHQRYVPGRACSLADLGSDTMGAALGCALVGHALTRRRLWLWATGAAGTMAIAAVLLATFTSW